MSHLGIVRGVGEDWLAHRMLMSAKYLGEVFDIHGGDRSRFSPSRE